MDFTQHADSQLVDEDSEGSSSATTDEDPHRPQNEFPPWGKLVPSHPACPQIDLEVRPPLRSLPPPPSSSSSSSSPSVRFLNLRLHPGDVFNEYTLGRSKATDIHLSATSLAAVVSGQVPPPASSSLLAAASLPSSLASSSSSSSSSSSGAAVHNLLSNRHCKIYCMLSGSLRGVPSSTSLEVYVEDTSANGTFINGGIRLRRGERRLLNTGDEICLLNAATVLATTAAAKDGRREDVVKKYSYTFINVYQQRPQLSFPVDNSNNSGNNKNNNNNNAASSASSSAAADSTSQRSKQGPHPPPPRPSKNPPRSSPAVVQSSAASSISSSMPAPAPPPPHPRPTLFERRIEEWYDVRHTVGSGTCGEVRAAINRQTGRQVAVKIIGLKRYDSPMTPGLNIEDLKQEAEMLRSLDHPYIVKLEDVFTSSSAIYLVMELLNGGDLFDRIVARGRYQEVQARRVMRRILAAVGYLHSKHIVHRDLKPENILLVSVGSDVDIKITDFGLAKRTNKDGLRTFCGTPQYFAPEVLRRRNTVQGTGRYGMAADMWSIGVILYILLSGSPPFDVSENLDSVQNASITFRGPRWADVSPSAKDLVLRLLTASPTARCTVGQAVEHEWINVEDGDTHTHPFRDPAFGGAYGNTDNYNSGSGSSRGGGGGGGASSQSQSQSQSQQSQSQSQGGSNSQSKTSGNNSQPLFPAGAVSSSNSSLNASSSSSSSSSAANAGSREKGGRGGTTGKHQAAGAAPAAKFAGKPQAAPAAKAAAAAKRSPAGKGGQQQQQQDQDQEQQQQQPPSFSQLQLASQLSPAAAAKAVAAAVAKASPRRPAAGAAAAIVLSAPKSSDKKATKARGGGGGGGSRAAKSTTGNQVDDDIADFSDDEGRRGGEAAQSSTASPKQAAAKRPIDDISSDDVEKKPDADKTASSAVFATVVTHGAPSSSGTAAATATTTTTTTAKRKVQRTLDGKIAAPNVGDDTGAASAGAQASDKVADKAGEAADGAAAAAASSSAMTTTMMTTTTTTTMPGRTAAAAGTTQKTLAQAWGFKK